MVVPVTVVLMLHAAYTMRRSLMASPQLRVVIINDTISTNSSTHNCTNNICINKRSNNNNTNTTTNHNIRTVI